ncbi:MAG: alkyl hydroperoxide reductase [Candidatus Heimdallarchaeota archaeon]|nr:alkyl hydroperoxide reductase [Candidatus Heimdallarchaeota archaeon]
MTIDSTNLQSFTPWFYGAAIYNLIWGLVNVLQPTLLFNLVEIDPPTPIAVWQVVGMFVLVYAPAYYWVARHPEKYEKFIVVGLVGKIFGPIGFLFSYYQGDLPLKFGLIILANDIIWWPAFTIYLLRVAQSKGWKEIFFH